MSEPTRPDDRELEDFLAGRGETSRRYRQAVEREGPPEALDHAILGQARRALDVDQRAKRRRFVVPVAVAATVMLSFSVFVAVRQERAGSENVALSDEERAAIARPRPLEALPAPAAPPAVAEAAATRKDAVPKLSDREFARVQAQLRQEADQRKAEQPAVPPPPPATAAGAVRAEQAAGLAAEPAKSAAAPKPAQEKRRARRDERAVGSQAALQRIRALKEKGDIDDARRELDKFRMMHPDDEVPDDLRPLMRPVLPPTP